ncbi:MAG: IS66 family insertion sequence element accessory protein TnpB [Clostridiaceae bacterium]
MATRTTKINWEDMIEKFNSYEGTVTDFCKENNINKSQFYAYRKKLCSSNITTFHAIPLKKENTVGGTDKTLNPKEIRIEIIDKVNTVYLACGITDLRKSIDGLAVLVETELKLDPFEKALFVFCNKQMNRLKILHFDEGFWLYYFRLENSKFKWPMTKEEALKVNKEELKWLLKGYEIRTTSKFKPVVQKNYY